jgi:hypothetical protein
MMALSQKPFIDVALQASTVLGACCHLTQGIQQAMAQRAGKAGEPGFHWGSLVGVWLADGYHKVLKVDSLSEKLP